MSRHDVARGAEWIYGGVWTGLTRWFRVPDRPPSLPAPPGEPVDTFRPAPGFLRYLKIAFWLIVLLVTAAILVLYVVLVVALWQEDLAWVALVLAPVFLVTLLVPSAIAYLAVHLRFDTTYYVVTDRSLRIRRGVWIIQETTITFENIQNMRISRGPLQQLCGIADLVVETAGSGGADKKKPGGGTNQGIIQGIDHAESLRDRILPHLRFSSRAGLGDEGGDGSGVGWSPEHLAVLREIRDLVSAT